MVFAAAAVIALTLLSAVLSSSAVAQDSRSAESRPDRLVMFAPDRLPEPSEAVAVGRKPLLEAVRVGTDLWISGEGRITTPLPVGYPAPTAPGALELKSYPSIRRAEVTGKNRPDMASNMGFFKLFNHIKSRDIAMTAPVEMDYMGMGAEGDSAEGGWSMAFLYRESDMGPVGEDGDVAVSDSTPRTYLSLGGLGNYGMSDARRRAETLRKALAELEGFEAAGTMRVLHYNGPEVRNGRRWSEVQIPVRLKAPTAARGS